MATGWKEGQFKMFPNVRSQNILFLNSHLLSPEVTVTTWIVCRYMIDFSLKMALVGTFVGLIFPVMYEWWRVLPLLHHSPNDYTDLWSFNSIMRKLRVSVSVNWGCGDWGKLHWLLWGASVSFIGVKGGREWKCDIIQRIYLSLILFSVVILPLTALST